MSRTLKWIAHLAFCAVICYNISIKILQIDAFQGKIKYARVVELVDSLDSGSSVHCGRAGSSPASRTKRNGYPKGYPFSFYVVGET